MVNVQALGAIGDGVSDDSAAVDAAIKNAQAEGGAVFFPSGKYRVPGLPGQSGRITLFALHDATLIGNLTYHDVFPLSADTLSPPTEDAPYFVASGISFKTPNSDFALTVAASVQGKFIDTAKIEGCRFYGSRGLKTQNLITLSLDKCSFHNSHTGWRAEGCTNCAVIGCTWHNQASFGVYITPFEPNPMREGGENIRFSNCEWAVCSYGLYVVRHDWLSLSNCLLDYCGSPLALIGSNYAKVMNTYLGSSDPTNSFGSSPDFRPPFPVGISVFAIPYADSPHRTRVVGGSFDNCQFINYTNNGQPPVYCEGSAAVAYGHSDWDANRRAELVQFTHCLFHIPGDHVAETLLQISNALGVSVHGNRFKATQNTANTIASAYRLNNCVSARGAGNDFFFCRDGSNSIVGSPDES